MKNNQNILIVDQENSFLDLCSCYLEETYENVFYSNCSKHALSFIKKQKISLILIEVDMPLMNGFDFIQEAKKNYPEIQFIIMSNEVSVLLLHKAIHVGVFDYLEKPFSRTTLIEKTESALRHQVKDSSNSSLKNILNEINHEKSVERKSLLLDLKEEILDIFKNSNGCLKTVRFDVEALIESKIHADQSGLINLLTPTEKKISEMLEAGLSARIISRKTDRSLNTIQVHIRSIRKKLGLTKSNKNSIDNLEM